jgi:heptosyltransferase-2
LNDPRKIAANNILILCPNWVGDVVMATPTFDCLRQNFPEANIIGLIRPYARGVIEDGPWFDRLVECDDKNVNGFFKLIATIRNLKPDLTIVLPNSFRSALIARLGGSKHIYGYRREGRSIFLSGGPRPKRNNHGIVPVAMRDYYLEICRWLQLKIPEISRPRLFLSDALMAKGAKMLEHYGITPDDMVIGLNPGAKFGSSKCWPPRYFSSLADLLAKRWDCKLLLFVGPGEEDLGRSIAEASDATIIDTGPDRVDLALLKPLIKRCQLLVTNDTGPRHYAVAFEVPVIVIMGPTDPRYTDTNLEKTLVLRQELDCSPCHEKTCSLDHECMLGIKPEDVLKGSEKLLKEFA